MGFRLGLVTGLGIGYTLGAKAGRERYEQIVAAWQRLNQTEPAQQLSSQAREAAHRVGETLEHKAGESMSKVTGFVKAKASDGSDVYCPPKTTSAADDPATEPARGGPTTLPPA